MSRFWVGDKPGADTLAALVPGNRPAQARHAPPLAARRAKSRPRSPPARRAAPPKLETLPTELRTQLFAYDGYNLIRELISFLTASRTCRDTAGAGPRTMITSVLPALRAWRNRVFPTARRRGTRVNSWNRSPMKRAAEPADHELLRLLLSEKPGLLKSSRKKEVYNCGPND